MAKIIGCTWFLQNKNREFLMMLRDNKPDIPYPGHWVFPGGTTEGDETPEEASIRELKEELDYSPPSMEKILTLYYPNRTVEEHFYFIPLLCKKEDLILGEGQKIELFCFDYVERLNLGFWCREVIPILKRYCSLKCLFQKGDKVVPIQNSVDNYPKGWADGVVTRKDKLVIEEVFFYKDFGKWMFRLKGFKGGVFPAEEFILAD